VDVTENVLGADKIEDVEFCQKSFLFTFSKNWIINFELLKKSLEKVVASRKFSTCASAECLDPGWLAMPLSPLDYGPRLCCTPKST
jgi:hypothetical protein